MTSPVSLPESVGPGPTKPEVRAIVVQKLDLRSTDHFVDVGAGSGAVSIAAGQVASRVTAIERDPKRVEAIRSNVGANDVDAEFEIRHGEAPDPLPAEADAVFIGGTRRFEFVLDEIRPMGVRSVVLNAARIQTAASAIEAFEARDLLTEVLSIQVGRGFDLGGETGFRGDNPVFVIVGSTTGTDDQYGGVDSMTETDNQSTGEDTMTETDDRSAGVGTTIETDGQTAGGGST